MKKSRLFIHNNISLYFWGVRCGKSVSLCTVAYFLFINFQIRGSSLIYTKTHLKFHLEPWGVEILLGSASLSRKISNFCGFCSCCLFSLALFLLFFNSEALVRKKNQVKLHKKSRGITDNINLLRFLFLLLLCSDEFFLFRGSHPSRATYMKQNRKHKN